MPKLFSWDSRGWTPYLNQRLAKIKSGFDKATQLLDPGRWPHPEIPARQMLWILTLVCFQSMGNYWMRHVQPDLTADFAAGIDGSVAELLKTTLGMDVSAWAPTARQRLRLPIRDRGCGLR